MLRDLPKSLISAVAQINAKSRQAFHEEQKTLQAKMKKMPEPKRDPAAVAGSDKMSKTNAGSKGVSEEAITEAEGTMPKSPREKKLAAMTPPKDKITHGDVLKGRGVRREAWDDMLKAVKARKDAEGTGKFDKKSTSTGTVYTRKSDTFEDGGKDADMKKAEKKMKKEDTHIEENKDTPGNSTHQCAIHVKSEQFGEGKTLFSQHAEPDADGNIAWYDVMFEHGIEKQVPTSTLEILVSEMHMHSKKKKKMM